MEYHCIKPTALMSTTGAHQLSLISTTGAHQLSIISSIA